MEIGFFGSNMGRAYRQNEAIFYPAQYIILMIFVQMIGRENSYPSDCTLAKIKGSQSKLESFYFF